MSSENFGSNKAKPFSQIGWTHDCDLIIQLHLSQVTFDFVSLRSQGWGGGMTHFQSWTIRL